MRSTQNIIAFLVLGATLLPGPVMGASHSWRVNEIFSNASGTIQFIELKETNGLSSEGGLSGKSVDSLNTGNSFNFPGNIAGDTANKHLLLATTGFAALGGAPTPDYTIADGFIETNSDAVTYNPYHSFPFGVSDLPTDGVDSIQVTNYGTNAFVTGANSPTNFAGESGTVDAGGGPPPDPNDPPDPVVPVVPSWGLAVLTLGALVIGLGLIRRGRPSTT